MKFLGFWSHHLIERGRTWTFQWWLHRREEGSVAYLELAAPSHSWLSLGFDLGNDEREVKAHLCLFRIGIYVGGRAKWARNVRPQEWKFSVSDGCLRLTLGGDPMSWSRSDPWWWHWRVEPARVLFGKMVHSEREVSRTTTVVPMPEKSYPCVVVMKAERWQRARLPWASHKVTRAHIEIPDGVPVPGKGENSWDCDDDAIYSQTAPAKTIEEGIANVVQSALNTRRRHGGSVNWKAEAHG